MLHYQLGKTHQYLNENMYHICIQCTCKCISYNMGKIRSRAAYVASKKGKIVHFMKTSLIVYKYHEDISYIQYIEPSQI